MSVSFDENEMEGHPVYSLENPAPKGALMRMYIASVYDGDTATGIQVTEGFDEEDLYDGKRIRKDIFRFKLRFFGPDAPEKAKGTRPAQPYAEESAEYVQKLILGKVIPVRILGMDKYRRYLADLYVPGCCHEYYDLGLLLIRNGLAFVYRHKSARYDEETKEKLDETEQLARNEKLNIWSQDHVVFQQEARNPHAKFDQFGNRIDKK